MNLLRHRGLDAFVVLLAVAAAVSVLFSDDEHRVLVAAGAALMMLVFLARSYSSIGVTVAAFAMLAAGMAIEPHATPVQFIEMLSMFLIAGAVNRGRGLVVAGVCGVGVLGYATLGLSTGTGWGDFALSSFISLGFLVAGWQVSRRTHELEATRRSASLAAAEHATRTREALADERARIARELHDVVSHGLTVVVVQTQAARRALRDVPATPAVERHLNAVESTAREALGEMRRMLGLLQLDIDEDGHPLPPSPGLEDLGGLIDRARSAEVDVVADLPDDLGAAQLGTGVELAVYRIIQESLTNVIKHAPGARAHVRLRIERDRLEISVRNPAGPGAPGIGGHGLVGMRERANTYGGKCSAGRVGDDFEVHAVMPLEHHAWQASR